MEDISYLSVRNRSSTHSKLDTWLLPFFSFSKPSIFGCPKIIFFNLYLHLSSINFLNFDHWESRYGIFCAKYLEHPNYSLGCTATYVSSILLLFTLTSLWLAHIWRYTDFPPFFMHISSIENCTYLLLRTEKIYISLKQESKKVK